ncbi:MAG: hypothetical protein IPH93_12110 [Saprospiraceae bacterium]|nr:hypothetical protein [Saprospiraceae bacterium]
MPYKLLRGISTKSIQWVFAICSYRIPGIHSPSSGKKDPSAMYLVYGNPLLIKKAMDEARKSVNPSQYSDAIDRSLLDYSKCF